MTAPAIIHDLVQRFRDSRELYRSGRYNEAQLRQEFLNPLFETLGWDMFNRSNFAPQYREVIHEDSLEDEGSLKAPDYAFRIGTTRKFFVEAKKPAVDIRYAIHPAYQLRRYAWNAHLPLSILTDFEELAVYDCRTRPDPKDSAATGRVMLFTFEEYLTRWDELAQIFSREAVWSGSFDRYAEGSKGKRGTTEVDAEFLKEIEQWRLLLARNIALRNFRSSDHAAETLLNLHRAERQLNYAVQTTIDRILFLRICEDRQIEPTDQLLQIAEGSDIYAQLLKLFQKADQKYNSGLFHFNKEKTQTSEPDTFTPTLQIDDKVLRQVIKSTYYPCPYMFNEIPVEILGQVYEQFLGSVIRLTPGGQAKVEEKPEVRKAGGVYYTPRYIVDYIVQNTIGRLLGVSKPVRETCHGLPANEVQPSFQVPHPPSAGLRPSSPIPLRGSSTLRPKEGLEGVGSNRSLSGETSTNINSQQSGLTSLTPSSVAVGGGLAGGCVGEGAITNPSFTPAQALKLRVVDPACGSGSFLLGAYQYLLDWHLNYYLSHDPESHTRGKNPPLVATEGGEYRLTTQTKKQILTSNIYGVDIDAQAVEVTKLSLLLKLLEGETGQLTLGFERVLPDLGQNIRCGNSLIGWDYFGGQIFPDEEEIQRVNPFDWQRAFPQVFAEGGFDAVIGNPPYIFTRSQGIESDEKDYYYKRFTHQNYQLNTFSLFIENSFHLLRKSGCLGFIVPNNWLSISSMKSLRDFIISETADLMLINNKYKVFQGANIDTSILIFSKDQANTVQLFESHEPGVVHLIGSVKPDYLLPLPIIPFHGIDDQYVSVLMTKITKNAIPLEKVAIVKSGFVAYETGKGKPSQTNSMKERRIYHSNHPEDDSWRRYLDGKDVKRYEIDWSGQYIKYGKNLAAPRNPVLYQGKRILIRQIPSQPPYSINGMFIDNDFVNDRNSMIVKANDPDYDLLYLLGILNSRLISYWFDKYFGKFQRKIFPQFKVNELAEFPICIMNDKEKSDKLAGLVSQMIWLKKQQRTLPLDIERQRRAIDATDAAIDLLVYELYDLTEDEIRIVESAK